MSPLPDAPPSNAVYGSSVPAPNQSYQEHGYGESQTHLHQQNNATGVNDFATGYPSTSSPLTGATGPPPGSVTTKDEIYPLGHAPGSTAEGVMGSQVAATSGGLDRSTSTASTAYNREATPSRSGTLKKKASVSRKSSLKRSSSRKSLIAGSTKGVGFSGAQADGDDYYSALFTPIPTHGSPTEVLANRFQGTFSFFTLSFLVLRNSRESRWLTQSPMQHGALCSRPSLPISARCSHRTTIVARPS